VAGKKWGWRSLTYNRGQKLIAGFVLQQGVLKKRGHSSRLYVKLTPELRHKCDSVYFLNPSRDQSSVELDPFINFISAILEIAVYTALWCFLNWQTHLNVTNYIVKIGGESRDHLLLLAKRIKLVEIIFPYAYSRYFTRQTIICHSTIPEMRPQKRGPVCLDLSLKLQRLRCWSRLNRKFSRFGRKR